MNKNDKKYKILTPNGWADFDGIKKIPSQPTINICLLYTSPSPRDS